MLGWITSRLWSIWCCFCWCNKPGPFLHLPTVGLVARCTGRPPHWGRALFWALLSGLRPEHRGSRWGKGRSRCRGRWSWGGRRRRCNSIICLLPIKLVHNALAPPPIPLLDSLCHSPVLLLDCPSPIQLLNAVLENIRRVMGMKPVIINAFYYGPESGYFPFLGFIL